MNEVRMKKRILSAVLAFLMAVSLVPVSAFASTATYADAFTVCVTGGDEDAKLDGASVDYTIEVDGTKGAKNTVTTTDGEAVIQEMTDYAQDIADGKAVTLAYTVSAEGYDTVSDRAAVTDVTGNVDVKLTVKTPDTVNVTVTKTGNGLVRINDQETETSTVEKGGDVKLELIPAKGAYIQELTVKGEPRTVKKGETFQETLTADEDITVSVTFAQEYTVTVTADKGGEVLLDGEAVTEKTYKEGTEVELSVAADDDYQIESIAIDGTQEDIADTASFTKKLTVDSWDGNTPPCQFKKDMGFTVDAKKNNSNDVHILLTAEDNAGNVTSMEYSIKIDITKPIIDIEYDKNAADSGTFFRESRRATVTVKERNFEASLVNITLRATDDGADIALPTVSKWTSSGDLHTATIEYTAEGDYTFAIACTDQAGNPNEPVHYADGTVAPTAFTIDKTRPTISVTYDNNSALNGNYYNANRTATVVVTEHNFDASRVNITLRATDDGADIALPTVSGWTSSGDRHTATIAYQRDGLYTFDIDVTDKAGNTSADFTEQTFYVDTTAPTLEITGVADRSANNGDIIPVVSYSDTNYDDAQVNITLTGAMRKGVALDGSYADQHNGKVFTFKNFAKEKEVDDIYTLAATLTDKAGNTTEKTILFSANRFGSTYALSAATEQLNGSYVQTPQDVVVTETNPDALQNIRITLFKNNQTIILQEGTDYRIEVRGGNGQWYEYIYTVLAKNFADDGVYRLTFYSEDAAGNIAENTLDAKKQEIGFGVDKTKPNMVVTNLESDTTYPLENLTVSLSAGDNLLLQSVVVYLDDYSKAYKTWTAEEIAAIVADQGEFTFDIPGDSTGAHQVKIVCTDAAGNEQTEEITNFYVTTNLFVRYYNNKPLFFGSIAAVVVIAGVVIALAAGKKKKNDKEK